MVRTILLTDLLFYIFVSLCFCYGLDKPRVEKKLFMATERPVVTFLNRNYFSYGNITSLRYGRRNPQYYVNLHYTTLFTAGNNVTGWFWFYEYYSSQYRRSFLEMSFKWCNLVYKDSFFGPALRKNLPKSCPHKPGDYHLYNMTASMGGMPELPFTKGRIYTNFTVNHDIILSGYIDIEFKRKIIPST